MELLIPFLLFGFVTSAHCLGMCGPLVLALPLKDNNFFTRFLSSLIYNFGRVLTYSILGLIFGAIGQGLELAGFQKVTSIIMGVLMIISVVFPKLFKQNFSFENSPFSFINKVKTAITRKFSIKSNFSLFTIGILNGFLPCGPVYIAVFMAIATNSSILGALGMAVFGLGTIPTLLTLSIISNTIGSKFKKGINKIIPYIVVILGILFIFRGLGLGIKYISPADKMLHPHSKMEIIDNKDTIEHCCHK